MELPVAVTSVIDAAIESVYSLGKYAEPTVVLGELLEWFGLSCWKRGAIVS